MLKNIAIITFAILSAFSASTNSNERLGLRSIDIVVDYRFIGISFFQDAVKDGLKNSIITGGSLGMEIPIIGNHVIGAECKYFGNIKKETEGSAQLEVVTSSHQFDFLYYYKYYFRYISLIAGGGPSLRVPIITANIYHLGQPSVLANGTLVFREQERILTQSERSSGVILGGFILIGTGLDVGKLFRSTKLERALFFNLATQYSSRDMRHEITLWSSISIHPLSIGINSNKNANKGRKN